MTGNSNSTIAYAVRYTDLQGERLALNGIAYAARRDAKKELTRVLEKRKGHPKMSKREMKLLREYGLNNPAELLGRYWRIKKLIIKK